MGVVRIGRAFQLANELDQFCNGFVLKRRFINWSMSGSIRPEAGGIFAVVVECGIVDEMLEAHGAAEIRPPAFLVRAAAGKFTK